MTNIFKYRSTMMVMVLATGLITAGTVQAKGPVKEDLLKSVLIQRYMEAAIEKGDANVAAKSGRDLQRIFHGIRDNQPDWFTSKGGQLFGKYSIRDAGHSTVRARDGYTPDNGATLREAITRSALVPIYPTVGKLELVYNDAYLIEQNPDPKSKELSGYIDRIQKDYADLVKDSTKDLKDGIQGLGTMITNLSDNFTKKKSSEIKQSAQKAKIAIVELEIIAGVPAK